MASSYPLPAFHFTVESGFSRISFTEVRGLEAVNIPLTYREGNSVEYSLMKIPGMQKFTNLIMKRGICAGDNDLATWFNTIQLHTVELRDLTVALLNENHEPSHVWKVKNAWPVRVTGPVLDAINNTIAFEEIEITHEGITSELI